MKKRIMVLCVSLTVLLAVRMVLMATMPVFEPSEARYAAISANMARTGDYLVPRFTYKGEYQSFDGKPPLVFQTGALLCRVLGVNEFAVRLMPFLSYVLILVLLWYTVRKLASPAQALLATSVCATCNPLYATAGVCMTDVPLSGCVVGALLLYACHSKEHKIGYVLAIGALLGCGMLIKGPVAVVLFVIPVVADAVLNRRWNVILNWRWLSAAAVLFAVAAPWFVLMERQTTGFLRYFFVNENLLRFLVHDYGDKYGAGRETFRGMALVWMTVVALPWSLLFLKDVLRRKWNTFDVRGFFFVSFASITAFWCLTSRVPMTYLLPAVPMFSAWLATRNSRTRLLLWRTLPFASLVAVASVSAILMGGILLTDKMKGKDAPKKASNRHFAYEFYHGPWGKGALQ